MYWAQPPSVVVVPGQRRSSCRGAIAEEQISTIHGGSTIAFIQVLLIDAFDLCQQLLTV